ncbi:uncharacterized protein PFL1_02794 [Pseudozyma flocculosa PF-1]|uniref:Uncharacterized protein n=2 Tax=Pseudozyma flocculosa TaxID=84751 RepID=A0A5C3F0T5_9BASI|nr:uncharacterized protein PFL1_02794 [Pseudozyma flocculosa PF-1]EPQ29575.1 hypothetical protein PFL1_02794 [Pseudozyma flocculosa PF-1]SPO38124.1 uncharacterized protein PSFLO_03601 [Pseudozyma flocculosa]
MSYTSFDDAIDDGVESEEKGERHQFGPKAHRFFQQAYRLYSRAAQLRPSSPDALYNAARVQYLLATQFCLPPESIACLADSVFLFKAALNLAPLPAQQGDEHQQASLPSPFSLDVVSNLATSLQSLGELVDEVGWLDQIKSAERLASIADYSAFDAAPSDTVDPRFPTSGKLLQEAIGFFRQASLGQEQVLLDQASEPQHDGQSQAVEPSELAIATPDDDSDMADDDASAPASTLDEVGYTSSLVTVDTYVDTLISLHACLVTLLASCETVAHAQICTANAMEALDRAAAALDPSANSRLPPLDETERETKALELQRARLSLRIAHVTRIADLTPATFPSTSEEADEVEQLEQTLLEWSGNVLAPPSSSSSAGATGATAADTATLCELGDGALSLTRLRLRVLRRASASASGVGVEDGKAGIASIECAWTLGTTTSRLFNAALSTLSPTSAGGGGGGATQGVAVLGAQNTSTPTTRLRSSILCALASTSLVRSDVVFESSNLPNAVGSRAKLIENARAYARKGCLEIGLGWIFTASPTSDAARSGGGGTRMPVHPHNHGGWETLSRESELVYTLLRSLFFRAGMSGKEEESRTEIRTLASRLSTLASTTKGDVAFQLAFAVPHPLHPPPHTTTMGIDRFLSDLCDEEGQSALGPDEIEFWSAVKQEFFGVEHVA